MRTSLPVAATILCAALPAQTVVESPLPAADGWNAARIHASDGGIWYAYVGQVVPQYGPPEVVLCDDLGRVTVLSVYSGKWTPRSTVPDNQWLAPSAPADVDPRWPGREIYAGGRAGNLHRVVLVDKRAGGFELDSVEIGHVSGEEFHCLLAGELDPADEGDEVVAFGITGAVYAMTPDRRDGDLAGTHFVLTRVALLPGRVRDAVLVPGADGASPTIYGVSRSGQLLRMRLSRDELAHEVVAQEPMGLGRIARRDSILYVTRDDGLLLRFEPQPDGGLRREPIFAGDQGLRGVAAGRFFEDPEREGVAVYGYGKKVQIVSRAPGEPWRAETVYTDDDQGHWLAVGELDGRNGTDELVATGFGGTAVLVSRPPGYALPGVAVEPSEGSNANRDLHRPVRIAAKASLIDELSPLCYQGGFETKSLIYETLVRRGPDGRIVPGLASSWSIEDGGRSFRFRLRDGATWHDGEPVTAQDVATHFERWVRLPEHAWLRCNQRIRRVEAVSDHELVIAMDRPYALLPDLCAINPTAIQGPGALDREGEFEAPIGSGPFALDGIHENGSIFRYRSHGDGAPAVIDLVRLDKLGCVDPLDALLRGDVDVVVGSWLVPVSPVRAAELARDPRWKVVDGSGSSMRYLALRTDQGPTADLTVRRRIAGAIDREELVAVCEHGFADPSTGWAAPSIMIWPQGSPATLVGGPVVLPRSLRLAAGSRTAPLLAETIAAQLTRRGLPTEVVDGGDEDWDLRIEATHGVPYDPFTTIVSRFVPPANAKNADSSRTLAASEELRRAIEEAMATPDDAERGKVYAEIQALLDRELCVVPLYAPRRIAVLRADLPAPPLDHDLYSLDASWLGELR